MATPQEIEVEESLNDLLGGRMHTDPDDLIKLRRFQLALAMWIDDRIRSVVRLDALEE